ncbi:MAG: molybdopterin molybdotransferase MoeA [Xanthomonadales bacterium]|nr:molybdopterin molybdotransferase MoeA [Xanthomonadales bacterium]
MHSVDEAVQELLKAARAVEETESIALRKLMGRVLAEDVEAPIDVPPADNSAMDGYALRHDDWPGEERTLPVSQRIPAGSEPEALREGTAARIFTGAGVPAGADTVVVQEDCEMHGDAVQIRVLPPKGANIRPRAQDMAAGQQVLSRGARMRPQEIGLLASLGLDSATVFRRLRVAVLSNGDELVEPGRPAGEGRIYNSNRYLLDVMLQAWGFEVIDLGIAPDDPAQIEELLLEAAVDADVILSSGGVSVGEEDHVKDVVAALGAVDLWKVAIKPGKPFAFGHVKGTPFLGLPGNPASVLVTALVVARRYLFACQGVSESSVHPFLAPALFSRRTGSRTEYLRARATPDGIECHPAQSSGILLSATWGDGLAIQPADQAITEGEPVQFLPYALLL